MIGVEGSFGSYHSPDNRKRDKAERILAMFGIGVAALIPRAGSLRPDRHSGCDG